MSNKEKVVVVDNLYKNFKLPHEQSSGIKQSIVNFFKREKGYETQKVLKGISFEIEKGDFFGIVGRNGSGKSTLLKLLAGIYTPEKGSIQMSGSIVPFIELGVGFNPELTGRENIFLNGALLGFSRKEMEVMYDDIVEFAELEKFMDQKLKNYSSGMQVRLAFSIAIKAQGDILILDEVLAVGDEAFQKKCNDYFEKIRQDKNKTIILVTHSMDSVIRYCNRAMLIVDGKIKQIGSPDKVANNYSDIFIDEQIKRLEKKDVKKISNRQLSDVKLDDVDILQNAKKTKAVNFHEDFTLELKIYTESVHSDLTMGVHFFDQSGRDMLAITTKALQDFSLKKGINKISFNIQNIFTDGDYYINLAIEENLSKKLILQYHNISPFSIVGLKLSNYSRLSLTHPEIEMYVE